MSLTLIGLSGLAGHLIGRSVVPLSCLHSQLRLKAGSMPDPVAGARGPSPESPYEPSPGGKGRKEWGC